MRRTGGIEGERVIAWLFVLGAHLLFWWLLTRAASVTTPAADNSDDALRMVWIDPPSPRAAPAQDIPPPTPSSLRPRHTRPSPVAAAASNVAAAITEETGPTPVMTARTMTAVFIEQARHLADSQDDAFVRDPLADRIAVLPGHGGGQFRMRKPRSVKRVVSTIGKLFGGGDFDPCPGIRQSIASLAADGDSEALQVELDARRRAACP
jgi:hypothetical protein